MSAERERGKRRRSSVGLRLIVALLAVFGVYLLSTSIMVYALLEQYWGFEQLADKNFGRAMTAAELTRDAEVMASEAFEDMVGVTHSYSEEKPADSGLIDIFEAARSALGADPALSNTDKWQKPYLDSLAALRRMVADERAARTARLDELADLVGLGDQVREIQAAAPADAATARFAASAWAAIGNATAALDSEQPGQIAALRDTTEAELRKIGPGNGASPAMTLIASRIGETARHIFDARLPSLQAQRAELAAARQTHVLAQKLTAGTVNYYLELKQAAQDATRRHQEIVRATILAVIGFLLIAVVITIFVVIYIARFVVRRLNTLNGAMTAHVEGSAVAIPMTGNDEIAAMGHAFEVFVTARDTAERALHAAREEAERANRAKSEFLANVSHEIRTPLNGILGFATLIRPTKLARTQAEYVEKIITSAEHLSRIIDDILDFSKIEAGRLDLDESAFDLADVLETVSDILIGSAESKGIVFSAVATEIVPPRRLIGDRLRLVQVLVNLAGNAVKFTERGSVELSAGLVEDRDTTLTLRFAVRDTGIGMTEAQLKSLFGKFHQADASITRRFGGTGLGLAISQHLVGLMGGEISVESVVGTGSTFSFTLSFGCEAMAPVQALPPPETVMDAPLPKPSAEPDVPLDPSEEWRDLHGLRVLLVDDQPLNREIATVFLRQQGVVVEVATGGREAVDRALGVPPGYFDAVLMDVQMPEIDGFQATRLVRATYSAEVLPIIAMTAHSLDEQRIACLEAGMNDHIAKPIEVRRLWGTLRQWTKPRASAPAAEPSMPAGKAAPDEAVLPDQLAGFDLAAGAAHAGGDERLFRKLLLDFPKWARIEEARILRALARTPLAGPDLRDAEIGAHSLVGMAASVSAARVAQAARALERMLGRDETKGLDELVRQVQAALDEACGSIESLGVAADDPAPPPAAKEALPGLDRRVALAQIIDLLQRQDFEAETRFHDYMRQVRGEAPSRDLQAASQAIEELDFRRAAFIMRGLLAALDEVVHG